MMHGIIYNEAEASVCDGTSIGIYGIGGSVNTIDIVVRMHSAQRRIDWLEGILSYNDIPCVRRIVDVESGSESGIYPVLGCNLEITTYETRADAQIRLGCFSSKSFDDAFLKIASLYRYMRNYFEFLGLAKEVEEAILFAANQ